MTKEELMHVLENEGFNKAGNGNFIIYNLDYKTDVRYIKVKGEKQEIEIPFNSITIFKDELIVYLSDKDRIVLKQGFYINKLTDIKIINKPHPQIILLYAVMYAVLNWLIRDTIYFDAVVNISDDGEEITINLNEPDYTYFHKKDCCIDGRTIACITNKIEIDRDNVTLYCEDKEVIIPLVFFAYENGLLEIKEPICK